MAGAGEGGRGVVLGSAPVTVDYVASSLISRIERKYCLISTSCLTGLFDTPVNEDTL